MNKKLKEIKQKIFNNDYLTSTEKAMYILYALSNGTGKMQNMVSLSTSCLFNPFCQARRKNGNSICNKCYAARQLSYQKNTNDKLTCNYLFFNQYELKKEDIPTIYTPNGLLRIEAHGDVASVLQAKNYYTIIRANKHLKAGIWSKNINLYANAGRKPGNSIIVFSNEDMNKYISKSLFLDRIKKEYPIIDKCFSVFSKEYAQKEGIEINCGGRSCDRCRRCYDKRTGPIVNELEK